MKKRVERDSMGELEVPADRLYGAQTARAVNNFPISGRGIGRRMIQALGLVKTAAAKVNRDLGMLDQRRADAIAAAANEVATGELDDHFPVDVFQTGSGTSSNMNANEVIANRAMQLLGADSGDRDLLHPNDHVNLGQSSNDVFPTAIHVAAIIAIERELLPGLQHLRRALEDKAEQFDDIVKVGRTHLQDAAPIRLGQEFSGYASQLEHGIEHLQSTAAGLRELAIGGTAVGTGLNADPRFGELMAQRLSELTGAHFREASNHFEAQAARDAAVRTSGALKSIAVSLIKIANDLRWLGSGPRAGLGELKLKPVQPGSSIMPGKINPVIAESLIQACVQVLGNDAAISAAGFFGHFELNAMQPLIACNLLEQIELLANATRVFADKLVVGLEPDHERIASLVTRSLALATALLPHIGYDRATAIANRAAAEGRTIGEIAREEQILPDDELEQILDPRRQTRSVSPSKKGLL